MKKFYLFFTLLTLSVVTFAQGNEDFTNSTATASYDDGSFVGNDGITFFYGHSRDQENYPISGNGLMLRRASDSYLEITLPSGVGNFSFDYRKAFTGISPRQLELLVDGVSVATTPEFGTISGEETDIYNFSYDVNTPNSVVLRIKNIGTASTNKQTVIDNVIWTAYTASCNLSANGLTAVSCNDAGTSSDPVDDYITFDLNPTGSNLGTTYTVSVASGTITPTTGTYGAATSFQLQAGSAGAGDVTVTITDDTDGGCTIDATVTDPGACSSATPVITVTPSSLTGFDHQVGTPSAEQTFTASGIALTDDIVLTAPADYEISETSGTGFTNSITLTQTAGTVAATTIYVRANAAAMGVINQEIVASSTGADNDTVFVEGYADDYVYYTIDEISTVDANGVADSMDVLVELTGVVHCMDFDGNTGYSITMIDGSEEGINVFAFSDVPNYTSPASGDSLRVFGKIGQFNGLLQVEVDSIDLLAQGAALMTPTVVTMLDETTESQYITLENLTFVNPIATFGSNENLDVTDGVNTFTIRIDGDTDLPGTPAPQVSFSVTGVGGQFDNSSPYTGSYQLFPCGTSSFVPSCTMPVNTVTVTGTTATADATGIAYQWIDCSDDSEINGATNASFTPTASGDYAVILTDGECVDTSNCVSIQLSGVGMDELSLEHAITVFPNPVQDVLTITNTSMDVLTVEVFTIGGQAIGTPRAVNATATIETQSWTKGVYFVVFSNENGQTHTERIIK